MASIMVSPSKTVLIVIDMHNFLLSSSLIQPKEADHDAERMLLEVGISAARKSRHSITHVTWCLFDVDFEPLPPTIFAFLHSGSTPKDFRH
jgi:hypothetical protein